MTRAGGGGTATAVPCLRGNGGTDRVVSSPGGRLSMEVDGVVGAELLRGEEPGDEGGDAPGVYCKEEV